MASIRPRLLIPAEVLNVVMAHAFREWPNECCGLLAGVRSLDGAELQVSREFSLRNVADDPRTEFLSEPRDMFEAVRTMRAEELDVLAVYHSHPTSEPVPSRKDVERSYGDSVVTLIVGLENDPPLLRGWWLTTEGVAEAEWELSF
jgi:[CysO sulfur-carrier protein]-S-L-cysteine hydrolase